MEDCIFCKIIKKEIHADVVYEDEDILAFKDINPVAPIHILVIPKKHISSLLELTEDDEKIIGRIYTVINKLASDINIDKSGFRVIVNCGKDAGQEVMHLHFHLLGGKTLGEKKI